MKLIEEFENSISENINCHLKLLENIKILRNQLISYKVYKKVEKYFLWKWGSAADAQHLAAEYLIRLRPKVNRHPLPALFTRTST